MFEALEQLEAQLATRRYLFGAPVLGRVRKMFLRPRTVALRSPLDTGRIARASELQPGWRVKSGRQSRAQRRVSYRTTIG